jgi:hypothetical protein
MAANKAKPKVALGNNPLSQGIFSKTVESTVSSPDADETVEMASIVETGNQEPKLQVPEKNNQESRFLSDEQKEKVNLRLSVELNDWLDDLLKKGKRQHGHKIAKEVWVQAALELFRALPVDWHEIDSEESLRATLLILESRIKNQVS